MVRPSRVYRTLLWAYPAEFRQEYGGQMEIALRDRLDRANGSRERIRAWVEILGDLVVSAIREHLDILGRDVRHGLRSLKRSPSFAAVAIGALAAGIGVNTAIFSVVHGVLLKPLPYPNPDRIVMLTESVPRRSLRAVLGPDFAAWREQSRIMTQLAVCNESTHILGSPAGSQTIRTAVVTRELFSLLGASVLMGREFTNADARPGGPDVAVLGHASWQVRFGGDPDIVGRTITLNAKSFQLVGVLRPGFSFPSRTEVWIPSREDYAAQRTQARIAIAHVIGRMREHAGLKDAEAELTAIAASEWDRPDVIGGYRNMVKGLRVKATPLTEAIAGGSRQQLLILFAAVALVLVIACVNVANLLVARAATRRREVAVRLALGASRARLTRQVLTESLMLAGIGSTLGIGIAFVVLRALLALGGSSFPRAEEIGIDWMALCYTAFAGGLTGILFGLAPAVFVSRTSLNEVMKEGSGGAGDFALPRLRSSLVVAQLALALVLLAGAGLLIRSFLTLRQVNPGFDDRNLLTAQITLVGSEYQKPEKSFVFHREAQRRLEELPGVDFVGLNRDLPINTAFGTQTALIVEGYPYDPDLPLFGSRSVNAGYFRTMRIPLRAGRLFTEADMTAQPGVVLVNEAFARLYFSVPEAVGKRVKGLVDDAPWQTIVGVVGDVRHLGLSSPAAPEVYGLYSGGPLPQVSYAIRTKGDPRKMIDSLRSTIRSVDSSAAIDDLVTMEERIRGSLEQRRFQMLILVAFAVLAAGLAGVGVYGVIAYTVSQRHHEMGIRIALGATTGDIVALVMREALVMAIVGLALGMLAAWGAGRAISGLLFQIRPTDPWAIGGAAAVLLGIAVIASIGPSWHAAGLDPALTLRRE